MSTWPGSILQSLSLFFSSRVWPWQMSLNWSEGMPSLWQMLSFKVMTVSCGSQVQSICLLTMVLIFRFGIQLLLLFNSFDPVQTLLLLDLTYSNQNTLVIANVCQSTTIDIIWSWRCSRHPYNKWLLLVQSQVTKIQRQAMQKINTFSRKPSFAQLTVYLISVCQLITAYVIIYHRLQSTAIKISFATIYGLLFLLKLVTAGIVSYIDPTDRLMLLCRAADSKSRSIDDLIKAKQQSPGYLFCQECISFVKGGSKHCKRCNRCVQIFDHHCIWINNCIGSLNYRPFLALLWIVQSQMSVYLAGGSLLWSQRNYEVANADNQNHFPLFQMVVVWIFMAIVSVFWVLNCNLVILHMYLVRVKLTTYEWLFPRQIISANENNGSIGLKKITVANDFDIEGNVDNQRESECHSEPNRKTGIFHPSRNNMIFPLSRQREEQQSENNMTDNEIAQGDTQKHQIDIFYNQNSSAEEQNSKSHPLEGEKQQRPEKDSFHSPRQKQQESSTNGQKYVVPDKQIVQKRSDTTTNMYKFRTLVMRSDRDTLNKVQGMVSVKDQTQPPSANISRVRSLQNVIAMVHAEDVSVPLQILNESTNNRQIKCMQN